jgi:hypothetical protein
MHRGVSTAAREPSCIEVLCFYNNNSEDIRDIVWVDGQEAAAEATSSMSILRCMQDPGWGTM